MTTRQLIFDDLRVRRYRVLDDQGQQIGIDEERIPTAEETVERTLRDRAQQALAANATYLALASPTTAQTVAQVQRLTRETSAIIRLMLSLLDSTDGT